MMNGIPTVTKAQMAELEHIASAEFGLQPVQMAENAGRNLADLAQQLLGSVQDAPLVVLVGQSKQAPAALVAARHLINWGAAVQLFLTEAPEAFEGLAGEQLTLLLNLGAAVSYADEGWELPPADLLIDTIAEYIAGEELPASVARLIGLANSHAAPILSLDCPSGLDMDSGDVGDPCVRARATLALALPKTGLLAEAAQPYTGQLYLADTSIPAAVYTSLGLEVEPLFADSRVRRL